MAGGNRIDRQEIAISALLTCPDIKTAAEQVGIGESTLWRWLREDESFQQKYRTAKQSAIDAAVSRLAAACGIAVDTLLQVAQDETSPASARVSAAKAIIEGALKAREQDELERRLADLEKSIGNAAKIA